ncbi:hypothetical protein L6452_23451 [Arctium lappa]|uniref:Uncharacterized protein n=1 Tax=Arctium lappa TaxID=4217 RepID=A0ACB9B2Y5_ARCLA|nr:hypothetical protein L6452_23451 [Arctium lappa]
MEEAGDLLEASWFFENLLHSKSRIMSRCYSDLTSSSSPPLHPLPSLCSTEEHVKNEQKSPSFSSRKQPPVAPPGLTRTPSLPTSTETQSFAMKKPNPSPNLMRALSMSTSVVGSDQEDHINVKKERKSSSFSSRKQPPVSPPSQTRVPSLPTSIETQSLLTKKPIPTSSMTTSVVVCDHEDEDEEEDQESEFTLGRLIRQASMNSSHTSNPPRQTTKAMTENLQKKPELDQKKIGNLRSMERSKSKSRKNNGGGGGGVAAIPGGWVDKSSSEDMKAHIKFWARAVASNVRQECS